MSRQTVVTYLDKSVSLNHFCVVTQLKKKSQMGFAREDIDPVNIEPILYI